MTARALVGALSELLMARLRGELRVSHQRLVDTATRIILTLAVISPNGAAVK
jgi:hypothetical protein